MISRRILAAVALLCAISAPSYAQKTKAVLDAEIVSQFPDNITGAITPSILRGVTTDIVNSIMPTAPVVSGNFACYSGTTGLLQDCGASPTSILASGVIYTAPFSGAVQETQAAYNAQRVSVMDFGATGNGTTDDTAAIAAAIAAAPSGGTVFYPCGTYLVSGSGTAVFSYSKVITHVGVGYCSEILLSASIPTNRDIFYFNPTTAVQGGGFKNIIGAPVSGSPGQHFIHVDTTANTAASVSDFVVENSQFVQTGGGYSLYLHGRSDGVGTKFSRFSGNQFLGGVNALFVGDTVNFGPKNFFGGASIALLVSQVAGAGNVIINNNNIVSNGFQAVVIDSGTKPIIQGNEIENANSATLTGSAVVDIRGSTATVVNPVIEDNQIQVNASTGNPTPLRIGAASGAIVDRNYISPATAQAGVVISSSATGAQIGCLNVFLTASPNYTNAGSGTQLCTPNNILSTAVNFNSVADTVVPIVVSTPRWVISSIQLSGCTGSISSAHFGIFTAAGGTGTTILTNTTGTITTASDNTANNMQLVAPTTGFTQSFTPTSVFFRVITAQGSAVTCNLNVIPIGLP